MKMKQLLTLMVCTVLMVFFFSTSLASERVDIQLNICPVESYETYDPISGLNRLVGPLAKPLVLILPDGHPKMSITLISSGGLGFTIDGFQAVMATVNYYQLNEYLSGDWTSLTADVLALFQSHVKRAKHCVSMYGYDEGFLWEEADAIPEGHREFQIGADVKYITVYSWYDLGPGEVFNENPIPARVAYEGAEYVE